MNDIEELLERTARSVEVTPSAETVEADVRRGRAALARRRHGRAVWFSIAGIVAVAAVVGAIVASTHQGGLPKFVRVGPGNHAHHGSGPNGASSVRLVAYHGEQLEGFTVDQIPEGWFLQGSNPFSLTIAPQGDASSPDAFEGKLVVMLLSSSAPQKLPQGDPVKVGNHDGVIEHGEADVLTYEDGAGHFVQIEAWHEALGWTDEQLTSFAEGVRVTANAQAGVG
jgi:hypothetical protein